MKFLSITSHLSFMSIIATAAPLNLSITTDRDRVAPGNPVIWSILLTNQSTSTENNVELRVTLPDGVQNGAWGGMIDDAYFNPDPFPGDGLGYDSGQTVTYDVGSLPPGESRLFQVTAFPSGSVADGASFTMMAQADSQSPTSFTSGEKSVRFLNSSLSLTTSANSTRFAKNARLEFSASYGYNGTQDLTDSTLEFVLPAGVSPSNPTSGWILKGNVLSWNLGTLRKGDNGQRKCTLVYTGIDPIGTIAAVKTTIKSRGSVSYQSEWPASVAPGHGLRTKVTTSSEQVNPGNSLTWSVLLSNPLNYAATGVNLRITLPQGVENGVWNGVIDDAFFNPDPSPGDGMGYESGTVVNYMIGTLPAGASRLFQIKAHPTSSTADRRQFIMTAQADSNNGMPSDASSGAVTFGSFIPIVPDIAVESPVGVNLIDNQVSAIGFGTQKLFVNRTKKFRIINSGKAPLSGILISKNGKHAADWKITALKTTSLSPGAYTTILAKFKPRGTGIRSATILIKSNDPNENLFEIKVTGKGVK